MNFLVEAYRSRTDGHDPDVAGGAVEGSSQGAVRYVGALELPSDEVTFHLFDAASRDVLVAALAAAGVRVDRISEVHDFGITVAMHGGLAKEPEARGG